MEASPTHPARPELARSRPVSLAVCLYPFVLSLSQDERIKASPTHPARPELAQSRPVSLAVGLYPFVLSLSQDERI